MPPAPLHKTESPPAQLAQPLRTMMRCDFFHCSLSSRPSWPSRLPRSGPPPCARITPSSNTAFPCATGSSSSLRSTFPKTFSAMGAATRSCCSALAYNVAPYGIDQYRAGLGPSELFEREKFIFVYQDVRGRFMSEGDYIHHPPPPAREERAQGHGREHGHLRHHRLADQESPGQHRQGGDVRHLAAGLLCDRRA